MVVASDKAARLLFLNKSKMSVLSELTSDVEDFAQSLRTKISLMHAREAALNIIKSENNMGFYFTIMFAYLQKQQKFCLREELKYFIGRGYIPGVRVLVSKPGIIARSECFLPIDRAVPRGGPA
jgi:hypothetical protein